MSLVALTNKAETHHPNSALRQKTSTPKPSRSLLRKSEVFAHSHPRRRTNKAVTRHPDSALRQKTSTPKPARPLQLLQETEVFARSHPRRPTGRVQASEPNFTKMQLMASCPPQRAGVCLSEPASRHPQRHHLHQRPISGQGTHLSQQSNI